MPLILSILSILLLSVAPILAQPQFNYFPESFEAESGEQPGRFWIAFEITNSGDEELRWEMELVEITRPDGPDIRWIVPRVWDWTNAPGTTILVPLLIQTMEMVEGDYMTDIRITSNDPRQEVFTFPVSISFSGVGAGVLRLAPEAIDFNSLFGALQPETDYQVTVAVVNCGEEPITLDSAVVTPEVFDFVYDPVEIPAGEYVALPLIFRSEESRDYRGTLTVYSSDAGADGAKYIPIAANIQENGVPYNPLYPSSLILYPSYPNPFNSSTTITYDVARPGFVRLGVYDSQGKIVGRLKEGYHSLGSYRAVWEGNNTASGAYTIRLYSLNSTLSKSIILTR